jgi:SAM-dependent methyltransferase
MTNNWATQKPAQIDFPGFEIEAEDTVVDVGCGNGCVCVYAGAKGADVIGIDIEPYLVDLTTQAMAEVKSRSFRGILSDANPIPLPDGSASVVIATEVLEHVDDPAVILAELFRIGRPGARYLISVPDPASESIMKALAPAWYFEKPIHIRIFEHDVLDRCLKEAGLEIESRHSSGFYFSMYWMLCMAIGLEHKYAEPPDHPAFGQLNGMIQTIAAAHGGHEALRTLDRLIPKSQVVIARKPVKVATEPEAPAVDRLALGGNLSVHGPARAPRGPLSRAIRDAIRDGSIELAGLNLSWRVRRTAK